MYRANVTGAMLALSEKAKSRYQRTMTDVTALEEQISHLTRQVEELSDVVAAQAQDLEIAKQRLGLLMQREAERELEQGGSVPLTDQRPPHW